MSEYQIPEDLKGLYEMARTDSEPYAASQVTLLIERIAILESAVSDEEWDTANPGTSDGETRWRTNVNTLINNRTVLGRHPQ